MESWSFMVAWLLACLFACWLLMLPVRPLLEFVSRFGGGGNWSSRRDLRIKGGGFSTSEATSRRSIFASERKQSAITAPSPRAGHRARRANTPAAGDGT